MRLHIRLLIFTTLLLIGLSVKVPVLRAYCAYGTCLGTTTADLPYGCTRVATSETGYYCSTDYYRAKTVNCGSSCAYNWGGGECTSDTDCTPKSASGSGNCCPGSGGSTGGGGGTCGFVAKYCPAGYIKSTNLTGTQCRHTEPYVYWCDLAGDAQTYTWEVCATKKTEPSVCGDWYHCPTTSNKSKVCRECTEEVWADSGWTVYDYTCVPTCSAVAPSAPVLNSPNDGQVLVTTSVNMLWSWPVGSTFGNACPGPSVNIFSVFLDECAASPAPIVNPTTAIYNTPNSTTMSYGGFVGTKGKSYCWYVRARNGDTRTNSATRRFKISADITGTVFNDIANNCGGLGWSTGGVAVSMDGGAGTAVSGTGTFAITVPDLLGHTLATSIPSGYSCSTAAGCNTCSRGSVVAGSINNFYLTAIREAWWRVEGAPIYAGSSAGGITVRSEIPIANYPLIQASGGAGTSGALIRGSGSVDLGTGTASSDTWSTISKYKGQKMDYNYFAPHMGVVKNNQASDWQSDTLNLPTFNPSKDFWYVKPTSGTASISTPWNVVTGQQYVVFVNGDLQINANITVASGGFLAFIVKGDVTVAPSVLDLQGLYVMNDNFVTQTAYVLSDFNDVQLTVRGSIIAWGSFSLTRNMGTENISKAVERFYYRPDLLTNMPDKMKTFAMEWQEVPAGTFGE